MNGLQSLQELAAKAHGQPSIPATVYQRKKTSLILSLSRNEDPTVRMQVVSSPDCPTAILKERILEDTDSRVIRECVLNPATKKDHLVLLIESAGTRDACAFMPDDPLVVETLRKRLRG